MKSVIDLSKLVKPLSAKDRAVIAEHERMHVWFAKGLSPEERVATLAAIDHFERGESWISVLN